MGQEWEGALHFLGQACILGIKSNICSIKLDTRQESIGGISLKDQSFQTGVLPFRVGKDGAEVA